MHRLIVITILTCGLALLFVQWHFNVSGTLLYLDWGSPIGSVSDLYPWNPSFWSELVPRLVFSPFGYLVLLPGLVAFLVSRLGESAPAEIAGGGE